MRIALDLDGVVADFIGAYLKDWNVRHGTKIKPRDLTEWGLESTLKQPDSIIWEDIHNKQMTGFFETLNVIPGARYYTNKLREDGHKIYAVTDRMCASDTYEWLKRNYIAFDKLYTTADKRPVYKHTDVAIDDKYENLIDALKEANHGILVSRKWNQMASENFMIKHASGWKEVYKLVNELRG